MRVDICVDVCIVGAGAAGLMCAIEAGKRGRTVYLIDKAKKAGRKILISGGGRCNFTNLYVSPEAYLSQNEHFCKSALARYTQWDFIQLLEKHQITWQEKTLGQLFCDQKAKAVLQVLLDECEQYDINIIVDATVDSVEKTEQGFSLQTHQADITCDSLVIASGGPSIPRMGSTDFGLQIAKQFGLKNLPFRPGLVPFTFLQDQLESFFKDLSGISLEVEVSCNGTSFHEDMLFTHRGLSGPAILQISSYWNKGDDIAVNLLPQTDAYSWLQQQQNEHPDTELKNCLSILLPKRLAHRLCETHFTNKPVKQFNVTELQQIAKQLHQLILQPSGTEGMRTAEVALGGVDTNELSSKTFQAKNVEGLYFIGETIDVTGHLGGYNFQWAWASGWCAGQYV
ncbi:MAG: NAD(P)/FAD-dependent oxidoreductase [Thiotrichaceae bacterium]